MVNLRKDPISLENLQEFLDKHSDFSFELEVLEILNNLKSELTSFTFSISHGGLYNDPNTEKTRQYDFRVNLDRDDVSISLAIECKNLQDFYPLLIERTQCKIEETCFDYFLNIPGKTQETGLVHARRNSIPNQNDFSGRNMTQVGIKDDKEKSFYYEDSKVYEKWAQAINSCVNVIKNSFNDYYMSSGKVFVVIPCLVIPSQKLWIADYIRGDKERLDLPKQVKYSPYYIGKNQKLEFKGDYIVKALDFSLNHLHICTLDGLAEFIKQKVIVELVKPIVLKM
jgi:hypothetical protein